MVEDVYEPLARYRDEFREKFSRLAREKFQSLVQRAGIDAAANRRIVAQVRRLEGSAQTVSGQKTLLGCLVFLVFLIVIGLVVWGFTTWAPHYRSLAFPGAGLGTVLGCLLIMPYRSVSKRLDDLRVRIQHGREEATKQMEPLNRLYTWDIPAKLIEATVPRLQFDPYFTAQRLADLERLYAWDDSFNNGKSILFAQSGVINGNPFVFGDYLDMSWGEETYEGSLEISWTEYERDSEGRLRAVTRHETLTASVTAPKPVYQTQKFLLYGNDAAPHLSFTRKPSNLSDAEDGFFKRWRMKRQIKRLQAFSRNLEDESNYTLMGNHEFEALFQTMDRTDEVEYRLLFTPVAQMQMLLLLKDRKVGYGDDFSFIKQRKINLIFADHLSKMTLDTDPAQFHDWDLDHAAAHFLSFNETYFKGVYFALAPLLAIPLYQQTRTHEDIWRQVIPPGSRASFWEHEALANFHGEKNFSHPSCITRSILKTKIMARDEGVSEVAVTAYGYKGVKHVTYKSVHGGDGRYHQVPVEWIEYVPVSRTRTVNVAEGDERAATQATAFRRSIYSWLGDVRADP